MTPTTDQPAMPEQWRSLAELANAPDFQAFARREFPGFANVYESLGVAELADDDPEAGHSRRTFLALSTAALGMAGLVGCRRPEIEILPHSAVPDDQIGTAIPGKPTFYATCIPRPGGALPILLETHGGRPTKIEGNPRHPGSLGSTDAHAQASILDLYSPDRVMNPRCPGVMEGGRPRRWDDFDRLARAQADQFIKANGKGLAVLAEDIASPSVELIRKHMAAKLNLAGWYTYEPIDRSAVFAGTEQAFGARMTPRYRYDKADRVLSLDADFLGLDPDHVASNRAFAARRQAKEPGDKAARLYCVESTYTLTGTMADHRLRLPSSSIGGFLVAVSQELAGPLKERLKGGLPGQLAGILPPTGLSGKWVREVARDLAAHAGKSLIVVGHRQPAWVQALAHAVNAALGCYASGTAEFIAAPPPAKGIADLSRALAAGEVETLLIIGGNPVLNAPADLDFSARLAKAATKIRLGLFHDQTSAACDWHLPLAHFLESWGDAEAADGSLCCVQPMIAPLNGNVTGDGLTPPRGGRSVLEVLTLLTQYSGPGEDPKTTPPVTSYTQAKARAYALVRQAFADRSGFAPTDPTFETEFNRYKQLGFLPADRDKSPRKPQPVKLDLARVGSLLVDPAAGYKLVTPPSRESLEIGFIPDYSLLDGRFALNAWLQELPDPITKLVWDNAALVSPKTAAVLGVQTGDVVSLTAAARSIEVPVFILPGQADFVVSLPFGQTGSMEISHVPSGGGINVFPLRTSAHMDFVTGCQLQPTGRRADLVTTQEFGVIPDGRDIVHELTLTAYHAAQHRPDPGALPAEENERSGFQGGYGNTPPPPMPVDEKQRRFPLDLARPERLDSQFQWGMVIDLNTCTGCGTCVTACQSENNIPVVGKAEVKRNREMHWIRLDRYFTGPSTTDPRIVTQPVACVHCESAPCESVCPVNAAVHSPEGLNLQVYNRCIGTRYCSNACPYKARRFNWFDFNKRGLDELHTPTPLARGGAAFGETGVPETLKMQKNPDVTVRMRGVMEKCTYCVQRIERGKAGAKIAAAEVATGVRTIPVVDGGAVGSTAFRKPANPLAAGYDLNAEGQVIVPDGIIVPACAAACPAQAITFGNTLDPTSRVAKLKKKAVEYLLLGELNTKPRTSYLPRVRNLNPDLGG